MLFDSVDRKNLLIKLEAIGVSWFPSCLTDKQQCVSICGVDSDPLSVDYGVFQGNFIFYTHK